MQQSQLNYYRAMMKVMKLVREDADVTLIPLIKRSVPEYVSDSEYVERWEPETIRYVIDHDGLPERIVSPAQWVGNYTYDATWPDIIANALRGLIARWTSPFAQRQADRIAGEFVKAAAGDNDRKVKSFGIDLYGGNKELQDYMNAAAFQNSMLIKSLPARYLEQVQNIVVGNMRNGMRPSYIEQQLVKEFGVSQRRAKLIARDQHSKIQGDMNRIRQVNSGFKYFKWVTAHDDRVRHAHRIAGDKVTKYGKAVYSWDDLPIVDGVPTFPGQPINCFPGTSPLNVFYGAEKAFRHSFSGKLTTLVTESGEVIECTPNHPVLTNKGFVAADLLDVGDHIVYVPQQTFHTTERHADSSDIMFSEFFKAVQLIGPTLETRFPTGGEFHGDIAENEKIDIVNFTWELPREFDAALSKDFFELFFTRAEEVFGLIGTPADSNLTSVIKGLTFAPDSIVGRFCELLTFLTRGFAHPDEHRFAAVGLLYSSLVENASDDVARSVEFFGDCFDTHAGIDARYDLFKRYILAIMRRLFGFGDLQTPGADSFTHDVGVDTNDLTCGSQSVTIQHKLVRVVDKRIGDFSGHVYNLQMERGLFVSHNFAVSNCRCVAVPVTETQVERNKKAGTTDPAVRR